MESKDYAPLLERAREARSNARWESSARAAQEAIEQLGGQAADDWIAARLIFGSSVACGQLGDLIEAAIERVVEAIVALDVRANQDRMGPAQRTLGYLFEMRSVGTRSMNLTVALHSFKKSLKHYTREAFPEDWAHLNIAIALDTRERLAAWADEGLRVRDDEDYRFRRAEIERAIASLRSTLEIFSEAAHPDQHREVVEAIESFSNLLQRLPAEG